MFRAMEQLAELWAVHTHSLLCGPPDMGKSELIRYFCAKRGLPLYILNPAKLYAVGDMDSERKLKKAFDEALSHGTQTVLLIQNMASLFAFSLFLYGLTLLSNVTI